MAQLKATGPVPRSFCLLSKAGDESPPPNDYYIWNTSDRVRTHQVDSATQVQWLPDPGSPSADVVSYTSWLASDVDLSLSAGFWITVTDDSHVVTIQEQSVP